MAQFFLRLRVAWYLIRHGSRTDIILRLQGKYVVAKASENTVVEIYTRLVGLPVPPTPPPPRRPADDRVASILPISRGKRSPGRGPRRPS